jgi:hypothetical protein
MARLVISYSREDKPQVEELVVLLRSALRGLGDPVFWDGKLDPGDPWFQVFRGHIDRSKQLYVFWCQHASTSSNVRREYRYAFKKKKRVVPVILDDTPLARTLSPIHGIDLRRAIKHRRTGEALNRRRRRIAAAGTVVGLFLSVSIYALAPRFRPAGIGSPVQTTQASTQPTAMLQVPLTQADAVILDPGPIASFVQRAEQYALMHSANVRVNIVYADKSDDAAAFVGDYLKRTYNIIGIPTKSSKVEGVELLAFTSSSPLLDKAAAHIANARNFFRPADRILFSVTTAPLVLVLLLAIWQVRKWRNRRLIVREFSHFLDLD